MDARLDNLELKLKKELPSIGEILSIFKDRKKEDLEEVAEYIEKILFNVYLQTLLQEKDYITFKYGTEQYEGIAIGTRFFDQGTLLAVQVQIPNTHDVYNINATDIIGFHKNNQ